MVEIEYQETPDHRILLFGDGVEVSINKGGYGMLIVSKGGEEIERYYGLEMAVDHAAELVGVSPSSIELPKKARDMGM
ncbi:MAG: hypothetical protein ABEK59_08340 [Halobacteria archaeon]